MVFITIHVHCMFVGLFGVWLLSFSMTTVVDRGANFPAIFIHRGSGESGNRGIGELIKWLGHQGSGSLGFPVASLVVELEGVFPKYVLILMVYAKTIQNHKVKIESPHESMQRNLI